MASLIVMAGPAAGRHLPLGEQPLISIGRDDQCTFQLLDEQVSRKHLQIRRHDTGDGHVAADYRSANGVRVNGVGVVGDVLLRDGDQIQIGTSTLVYTVEDFDDDASAAEHLRRRAEWNRSTLE